MKTTGGSTYCSEQQEGKLKLRCAERITEDTIKNNGLYNGGSAVCTGSTKQGRVRNAVIYCGKDVHRFVGEKLLLSTVICSVKATA